MSKLKNLKRYRQAEPEAWEQRAGGNVPDSPAKPKHKPKTPYQNWLVPGIIGLVFLTMIGFVVKVFLSDSGSPKKAVYQVTLIKPPPPEDKVKPPEPEKPKEQPKEALPTPVDVPQDQPADNTPPDDAPAGSDQMGVEGEGAAGDNAFGLGAKGKGYKGRDVTLGDKGGGSGMSRLALLTKYGWYTDKIQDEIKRQYKKRMEKDGGVPKGKFEFTVKILLDPQGIVKKYRIVTSSGNDRLDAALKASLPGLKISQAPPDGMPSLVTLRIQSQG
jgi:outer membrane biosynthesis protein TonB